MDAAGDGGRDLTRDLLADVAPQHTVVRDHEDARRRDAVGEVGMRGSSSNPGHSGREGGAGLSRASDRIDDGVIALVNDGVEGVALLW